MNQRQATKPVPDSESPVTDRATEKAHHLVDEAGERVSHMERKARHSASEAQSRLEEGRDAAAESVARTRAGTEEFIREKPLAAAGIAFAVGFLASRLLSR